MTTTRLHFSPLVQAVMRDRKVPASPLPFRAATDWQDPASVEARDRLRLFENFRILPPARGSCSS
jgi:hypothetical protein